MTGSKLIGGSDVIVVDGKQYPVRSTPPLSKAEREHLAREGSARFEDTEPREGVVPAREIPPLVAVAKGDRGESLDLNVPPAARRDAEVEAKKP